MNEVKVVIKEIDLTNRIPKKPFTKFPWELGEINSIGDINLESSYFTRMTEEIQKSMVVSEQYLWNPPPAGFRRGKVNDPVSFYDKEIWREIPLL